MHQHRFRELVLTAYHHQCTLCRLRHTESLDAAHIIGINPNFKVEIRTDILEEIDGPMLKHGIQEVNDRPIILPDRKKDCPDKNRLDFRFQKFKKAG